MVSLQKSAMKSTKEHLEETPKTNLKRKRTPGKENVWVLLGNFKIMKIKSYGTCPLGKSCLQLYSFCAGIFQYRQFCCDNFLNALPML